MLAGFLQWQAEQAKRNNHFYKHASSGNLGKLQSVHVETTIDIDDFTC